MLSLYLTFIDSIEQRTKFEKIYYAYRKQMFCVAYRILNHHEKSEDAVQDALLRIAENIETIRDDNADMLKAYALTAARNAAISLCRSEQKIQTISLSYDIAGNDACASLDEDMIQGELIGRIKDAITKLPFVYQEILMLRFVHEMDYPEIAVLLNRSQPTVRQQVLRAKKRLREICEKEGIAVDV